MILVVMGVAGCGKTTVGRLLAASLGLHFRDADEFHAATSVEKMARGEPLTEADRLPWLEAIGEEIARWEGAGGVVLACSALRESYRAILRRRLRGPLHLVYLAIDYAEARRRVASRVGHSFDAAGVAAQFDALEAPTAGEGDDEAQSLRFTLVVDGTSLPEEIRDEIVRRFALSDDRGAGS